MGFRRKACDLPNHFALAEYDGLGKKSDAAPDCSPEDAEKDEKSVTKAMQRLQGGLAWLSLALHMQHDYLAVIEGIGLRFEQYVNKEERHGRCRDDPPGAYGAITTYRAINALSNAFGASRPGTMPA